MGTLGVSITCFILGVGAGMGLHRILMAFVLDKAPDDLCAYCEWLGRKKSRHKKK